MNRRIPATLLVLALLVSCTAAPSMPAEEPLPEKLARQRDTAFDPFAAAESLPPIPSVTAQVDGEEVVLIDMQDPLTRSFYTGCPQSELDSLDFSEIKEWQDGWEIDARYTFPFYVAPDGQSASACLEIAAFLLCGGRLAELLEPVPVEFSRRTGGGLLFNAQGIPVTAVYWRGEGSQVQFDWNAETLTEERDLHTAMTGRHLEYTSAFVPTAEIHRALLHRGFDLDNTRVVLGHFTDSAYLFSDGEHEMLYFLGVGIGTKIGYGTVMSPVEYASYLVAQNSPHNVESALLQSAGRGRTVTNIKFAYGGRYKELTESGNIDRLLAAMGGAASLRAPAASLVEQREHLPRLDILIDDEFLCTLYVGSFGFYYEDSEVGLCDASFDWGERLLRLYDQFDVQEQADDDMLERYQQRGINPLTGKPVLYLYPTRPTDVAVTLDFDGRLDYTYPTYGGGWSVTAHPDGRLVNRADGSEHWYLFWEGVTPHRWNLDTGFVVPGRETAAFLQKTLAELGLTPREYNDFITYWVPQMQGNAYNLIHFSSLEEYGAVAGLAITPQPDSLLRVHMAWMALDEPVELPPQRLDPFRREGFCAVEWGGTEVLAR